MRGDVIPYKVIQVLFFVLFPSLLRLLQVDAFLLTVVSAIPCLVIKIFQSKSHKYIPPIKVSQIYTTNQSLTNIQTTNQSITNIYHQSKPHKYPNHQSKSHKYIPPYCNCTQYIKYSTLLILNLQYTKTELSYDADFLRMHTLQQKLLIA